MSINFYKIAILDICSFKEHPRQNTTYHEHQTLFLLEIEVQTMRMIQHVWAPCAMELKMSEQMIVFSLIMGINDDDADCSLFY